MYELSVDQVKSDTVILLQNGGSCSYSTFERKASSAAARAEFVGLVPAPDSMVTSFPLPWNENCLV